VNSAVVRIGTRGSQLALAQARLVADAFEADGRPTRLVIVETDGDRRAPDTAWGEGAFVAAIEKALLSSRVDVAVHSAKDVPTEEDPRLRIAAYLPRAEPRDALVVRAGETRRSIGELVAGSRVGTDSPRRTGFLLARRPDLRVHPLHGNVDTRLRRLDDGETDALILAVAGLARLGREDRIAEMVDPSVIPPAPGQGAIAVQIRADDARLIGLAAAIDHGRTRIAVETERVFLRRSGGGCRAPIGALATIDGDRLRLLGGYAVPDGSTAAIEEVDGPISDSEAIVDRLIERLGVGVRVAGTQGTPGAASRPRVLITRARDQSDGLVGMLGDLGLQPVVVPAIEIVPARGPELGEAFTRIGSYDWIVVTSATGAEIAVHTAQRVGADPGATRWAAVGPATAAVLAGAGVIDAWLPSTAGWRAIGSELPLSTGDRILLARSEIGDPGLVRALRERGAVVDDVVAYRTLEGPMGSAAELRAALARGTLEAVIFASGSAVRGLLRAAEPELTERCRAIPAICIGPATADEARAQGFRVLGMSDARDAADLAERTAELIRGAVGVTT
jgi:hydroxymethylbilane synthase